MARLPRYDAGQVEARVLPSVQVRGGDVRPDSSGVQALAGVLGDIAREEQDKNNKAKLMEFENALNAQRSSFLHDPEQGAFTRRGKDAVGMTGRAMDDWRKASSQIVQGVPTHLRPMAEKFAQGVTTRTRDELMRHEVQQADQHFGEQAQIGVLQEKDEAIRYRNDPAAVQASVDRGMVYASEYAKRMGGDPMFAARQAASGIYRAAIEAFADENPNAAEERLSQWRGFLTGQDQVAIEQSLRPNLDDRTGYDYAQSIMTGAIPAAPGGSFTGPLTEVKPSKGLAALPVEQRRALPYNAPELDAYAAHVEQTMGLPPGLINALKNAGEKSGSQSVSPKGARGVMQFMPENLRKYGVQDASDPVAIIDASGRYLRDTLRQYHGDIDAVIADYNGGPRQAKAVQAGRQPPAAETRAYLQRVRSALGGSAPEQIQQVAPPQTLAEAIALIPRNMTRSQRASAEGYLRDAFALREAQEKRQAQEQSLTIYDKVSQADPSLPLSRVLSPTDMVQIGLNSSLSESINRLRRLQASGQIVEDDVVLVDQLKRQQATDPNSFARVNLIEYADRLSGATLLGFTKDQQQASKPEKREQWATESQLLSLATTDMGITGEGNTKRRAEFSASYYREKRAWMEANDREPTADETQTMINRLKLPFVKRGFFGIGGGKRRAFEGPAEGYGVPTEDREQIVAALQASGIDNPTEAQILATYVNREDDTL